MMDTRDSSAGAWRTPPGLAAAALVGALWGPVEALLASVTSSPLQSGPAAGLRPTTAEFGVAWAAAVSVGALGGAATAVALHRFVASGRRRLDRSRRIAPALVLSASMALSVLLDSRGVWGAPPRVGLLAAAAAMAALGGVSCLLLPWRRVLVPALVALAALATGGGLLTTAPAGSRPSPVATADEPNLVLVTLDTTRFDHLWPPPPWMPRWRALSAGCRVFTAMTTPLPLTGPAHASLLTGEGPLTSGALDNGLPLAAGVTTLAELLSREGMCTGAVVSAAVLRRDLSGLDRGFDVYDDSFRPPQPVERLASLQLVERVVRLLRRQATGLSRSRPARETIDLGLRFAARCRDHRFFLWLHLYDPHAPYAPQAQPPPVSELVAVPGEAPAGTDAAYWEQRRLYAGELADVDAAMGRLREGLDALGLADRTLWVIATDHGESFGTHGHGYRFDHGAFLYDDEVRVLAAWREPGGSPFREENQPLQLGDLFTAMLRRMRGRGVDWPALARSACELQSMVVADTLWTGLRTAGRKLLRGRHGGAPPVYEAYDLRVDPGEQHNLLAGRQAPSRLVAAGADLPVAWLEGEARLRDGAQRLQQALREPLHLSPQARKALEALGYVR